MELRQIQYAISVAKEKNFSKAAEKLHIAQPSLSQQIIKLEKELGISLFKRVQKGLQLTYAGQRFVDQGTHILDEIKQLEKEMMDVAEMKKGELIIGSLPITGAHLLPVALQLYQKEFPGIKLVLIEETTSKLEEITSKGQTDLSLLSMPIKDDSLQIEPLLEEEILLAVPPTHPCADKMDVQLSDCKDEPFILLKKGQGFREIAHELCLDAGFEPNVVFESTNIETVKSLVASGMGISFIPKMVSRTKTTSYSPVYLSLKKRPSRSLIIGYKKDRYLSKAAEAFISIMKQIVKEGAY